MTKTKAKGSEKCRQRHEKDGGMEKPAGPVKIPCRIVAGLPLFYQALCEVMVRDGLVELTSEDTFSDNKR